MKTFIVLATAVVLTVLGYNFFVKETWQIVYYDSNDKATLTSKFSSEEACLDELHAAHYNQGECGSNCKYSSSGIDIYHCKHTAD